MILEEKEKQTNTIHITKSKKMFHEHPMFVYFETIIKLKAFGLCIILCLICL